MPQNKSGAWEVDFKNDYLFVSDLEGGFSIIDVKDKANPEIIDYLKTKGASYDVEVVGKFVYLADGFEGLKIYELESSQSYEITDDTETKNSKPVADIEVFGDEAEYENKSGVYIFNLNNPVYFSALGSYDVDGDDLAQAAADEALQPQRPLLPEAAQEEFGRLGQVAQDIGEGKGFAGVAVG